MNGPSKHLSWKELACKDGAAYPSMWRITRAIPLAEVFEAIRYACGDKPITVVSAYRTLSHNTKVGGAKTSQHMEGRALDLRPPYGMTVDEFYEKIVELIERGIMIRGLGKYRTFVHIDIRPTQKLARWSGHTLKDDRA